VTSLDTARFNQDVITANFIIAYHIRRLYSECSFIIIIIIIRIFFITGTDKLQLQLQYT